MRWLQWKYGRSHSPPPKPPPSSLSSLQMVEVEPRQPMWTVDAVWSSVARLIGEDAIQLSTAAQELRSTAFQAWLLVFKADRLMREFAGKDDVLAVHLYETATALCLLTTSDPALGKRVSITVARCKPHHGIDHY